MSKEQLLIRKKTEETKTVESKKKQLLLRKIDTLEKLSNSNDGDRRVFPIVKRVLNDLRYCKTDTDCDKFITALKKIADTASMEFIETEIEGLIDKSFVEVDTLKELEDWMNS